MTYDKIKTETAPLIKNEDLLKIDFFHDFQAFLNYLNEYPVKMTTAGNLSLKDIGQLLQKLKTVQAVFEYFKEYGWTIRKEEEIQPLHKIRILSENMNLTIKRKGKLSLTKKGRAFLAGLSLLEQYEQIVIHYWYKINWPYFSASGWVKENKVHFCEMLQKNQDIIWQILLQNGMDWVEFSSFYNLLRQNLDLELFLQDPYSKPEEIISSYISQNLI